MSDYLHRDEEYTVITHNGAITVGNLGPGIIAELKEMIAQKAPYLLIKNKICLGKISNNQLSYVDDEDMESLIANLITYVIIREEYRDKYREKRKNEVKKKPLEKIPSLSSRLRSFFRINR